MTPYVLSYLLTVHLLDCGERADVRHPLHLQRAAGVPRLLAHLLHSGRIAV